MGYACASASSHTWGYELLTVTHAAHTHDLLPRSGVRGGSPGLPTRPGTPGYRTAYKAEDLERGSLYRLFHRLRVSYRDLKNTTVHRVRFNYSARAHSAEETKYTLACRVSR